MFFVYMIKNKTDKLYIGISENPEKRLRNHNQERGATFTQHGNFKIVFLEEYSSLALARQREVQIKKWRRDKKEFLIHKYQNGLNTKP